MRNKKALIVLLASVFVLSGVLLGTQSVGSHIGPVHNASVKTDLAVSNMYLGSNITLSNVSINDSYYTNFPLGIWDGHMHRSLYANNLNLNSSGVLYTDGFNIYLTGVFDNKGHVYTGTTNQIMGNSNLLFSYGGSGGGTRANNGSESGFGGFTLVHGGMGTTKIHAQNGSSAKIPALKNSLIQAMYSSGFNNYLAGAMGQSYYYQNSSTNISIYMYGGSGSNGLYLQANSIFAGNISSNGGNGANNTQYHVYTGGGGAGSIILSYAGSNFTANNVSDKGGKGGYSNKTIYSGGNGGSANIYDYSYGNTPPISVGTQFHLSVIKPVFVFNGSTVSVTASQLMPDSMILNENATFKMSSINTNKYTYNYSTRVYINGTSLHNLTGTSGYNDSHSTVINQVFPAFGPRTMNLLNAGILSTSVYYMLEYIFFNGPTYQIGLQTGVSINTPMGYVLTDKLFVYNPILGTNIATVYVDHNSGLALKLIHSDISLEVTGTNIPLDHASAPLPITDIEIGGGIAAIAVVAGVLGYSVSGRRKKQP